MLSLAGALILLGTLAGCRKTDSRTTVKEIPPFLRSVMYPTSEKAKFISIPFKFVNNLVIVPININNSDTLRFIVDTGVKIPLLTNLDISDSLNLIYTRKVKIRGLGEGEDLDALHSFGNSLYMTNMVKGANHDILIMLEDVFFLSSKLGMRVHGIIGYDIFKNFTVEINYDKRTLTLYPPGKFKPSRKLVHIPMDIEDGKPYATLPIVQKDGTELLLRLLIDTGASYGLSLDMMSSPDITLPEKSIEAYLGKGLSGDIRGRMGRARRITLGPYQLSEPIISYPDSASIKHVSMPSRNGHIGADILKRFNPVFDYQNGKLYLRPSKEFNKPFYYNLSGVELATPMPGLPFYTISDVSSGSPAFEAGLRKGDEILDINNKSAFGYQLNDIIELLHSRPGRKILIRYRRDDKTYRTEFILRKPI
jgi:hypothetical protein